MLEGYREQTLEPRTEHNMFEWMLMQTLGFDSSEAVSITLVEWLSQQPPCLSTSSESAGAWPLMWMPPQCLPLA